MVEPSPKILASYTGSSQFAEPLWTDPGIKSGIGVRELISTLKKAQAGNEWLNILPKSSQARKSHHNAPKPRLGC